MIRMKISWAIALILFALCLALYVTKMAPAVVPGDPGEYQIVAARWGIGHPPGYGFYALLGNLFTHLLPIGTFAWRANLLSALCGAAIVTLAYGIGRMLGQPDELSLRGQAPALLGALLLASGLDVWQHAIHANAHIVTALLATVSLFLLVRWRYTAQDRWLWAFCVVAGSSPAHHPLLVFAFPAYAALIVAVRPRILLDWRALLKMIGWALLGLAVFLYYPLRCAVGSLPLPGPNDMNTWGGFVRVITAQGLRVNLFQFTPIDLLYRLWDVRVPLGLQYAPPALALAVAGLGALWRRRWRLALLFTGYLAGIVLATINILQDAMAYLLGPMVVVGVLAGLGIDALLGWAGGWPGENRRRWHVAFSCAVVAVAAIMPVWSTAVHWRNMDLSRFDDADAWLEMVERRFAGRGQHVALLTEWERMTTVWYHTQVEGRAWNPKDLRFVYIPAGKTFTEGVDENLAQGPVYLTTYRPFVAAKYRLLPSGDLWQVLPVWPHELPAGVNPVEVIAQDNFEIVGWRLNQSAARRGDVLLLDLYMRLPKPEGVEAQQYYLPWAKLGDTVYHFTTDSRFNTPWWQPGEIVGERFELPVPWRIEAGAQSLRVGVRLLNEGRDLTLQNGEALDTLTVVNIQPASWTPSARTLDKALGNLRGEIVLRGARVNGRRAPMRHPLAIEPGRALRVALQWASLRPIDENYTVFVQLLDSGLQVRAQHDMTPLGGSSPTWLWFPRWRRGTRIVDTHVLNVPADLPPGQYPLVVGMYGFATRKRVQSVLPNGDVEGDWITLAHLQVK